MDVHLNREIKAHCPDFLPIREILHAHGADFIEIKEQVDCFYNLPVWPDQPDSRRLKLRIEKGRRQLVSYQDRREGEGRTSRYRLSDVHDPQLPELLETVLGVKVVVRKQRELWRRDNVVFNLDVVEGVGQVFEVEVIAEGDRDVEAQLAEYRRLFGPFLGPDILGSNEDLVAGAS